MSVISRLKGLTSHLVRRIRQGDVPLSKRLRVLSVSLATAGALSGIGTINVAAAPIPVFMLPWTANPGPSWHDISGNTYGCNSHMGPDYYAIDFGLVNNPVASVGKGVVYSTGYDSVGGYYVEIKHDDGTYAYYGHLSQGSIRVSTNNRVREGDWIATSGQTGSAIGPHLHFRMTSGGPTSTPVKPEPMGATSGPSTSFGHWGYSLSYGCLWSQDPVGGGRGPGYFATAPAVAITSRYYSGDYVLDGYGGITPVNGAPVMSGGPSWPGWNISRDFKVCPTDDSKGYLLDGFGGISPVGNATPIPSQYRAYFGWDIARSIAIGWDCQSGYTLDGYGGIHPFAANGVLPPAPAPGTYAYHQGWDIMRSIVNRDYFNLGAGYVLDGYGGINPFAGAPAISPSPYWGWTSHDPLY